MPRLKRVSTEAEHPHTDGVNMLMSTLHAHNVGTMGL